MATRRTTPRTPRPLAPIFLLAALCVSVVACEDAPPMNPTLLPVYATPVDPDPVGLRLAQAAERATQAQNKMAQIESFRTPLPQQEGLGLSMPGLNQVTSLTWSGPIEQITRTLAEMGGLTFKKTGKEPPLPLVVNVEAHQESIGKILQDIGAQAGRRADLIIDPKNGTLDLHYAPTDGLNYY
jgi:defect in organelle trafficking protein DotD